jgi:hypothetical protein
MDEHGSGKVQPDMADLSTDELKSLTHGEFWIPEAEREVYKKAMRALHAAGVPFIVSGLYAIYEYTGIYRETKDLDLFFQPEHVLPAAETLRAEGFSLHLTQPHWLAKAKIDGKLIDLIFGMGNGLAMLDEAWYRHSRPGILAATPVRVAPPEELIWHRLFVSERHRWDMADIVHLILLRGSRLDWQRLLARVGEHWRLLLVQLHLFDYVYPGHRSRIPQWVREALYDRAYEQMQPADDPRLFGGTLISRFSFAIDVNEWGFRDIRREMVAAACTSPIVREIAASGVWEKEAAQDEEQPQEVEGD